MAMGWSVTNQVPVNGGVNVEYTTADGVVHYLFVGTSDYTVNRVKQLINDNVAVHDQVSQLSSGG